jgi:multisubunit Na+/H+ antiporter MnhB subunit
MKFKPLIQHCRPYVFMLFLYALSIVLRSQSTADGSMTQFYVVIIVFAVIVLAALLSFFVSQKKKRKD